MLFNKKLISLLKSDNRFVDGSDEFIIAAAQDCAWKFDQDLIKLLLKDSEVKSKFFRQIDKHWIFDANVFSDYISHKNFLGGSYTRFRNRIGLTVGGKYLSARGDVALVWPYKDCVLEGGQTKEQDNRKEIFFNEVLAEDEINRLLTPKVLTDFARHTARDKSMVADFTRDDNDVIRENLVIQGNNLLALHTIKAQFRGKVKVIYIDPPYNTRNSSNIFTYNNNFNHSAWLVFMRNRLVAAREFLTDDGFIIIAIDHSELFYLGVLADEVMGRENRIGVVTVVHNPKGRNQAKFFSGNSDYMLVYANNKDLANFNPIAIDDEVLETFNLSDGDGKYRLDSFMRARHDSVRVKKPDFFYPIYVSPDMKELRLSGGKNFHKVLPVDASKKEYSWKVLPSTFETRNAEGGYAAKKEGGVLVIYNKYRENQVVKNTWTHKKYQSEFHGTNLLKKLLGKNVFPYPKSLYTVLDTLKLMAGKNDIVMDFFSGSGTTAHAVLQLNQDDGGTRNFVLVEQLSRHAKICHERIKKVLETISTPVSFISCEMHRYNESFMDEIQAADSSNALMKVWRKMSDDSFLNWYVNHEIPENASGDFIALGRESGGLDKQRKLLAEMLDKNQLYVHLSEIDDKQFRILAKVKALNEKFHKGKK